MKLSFLESGIDSLKKGFLDLVEYEELKFHEDENKRKRFLYLKDAILFIQHGIEVLLKQILVEESTFLLFSQINDDVKKAYGEMKRKNFTSVFETSFKDQIQTVSFREAIDRVQLVTDNKISNRLVTKLHDLDSYRNIIMHSEAHLDENNINELFDDFFDELDHFFYNALPDSYRTISGYSQLKNGFENYKKVNDEQNRKIKSKAIELLLNTFDKAKISLGQNEVKRITNINSATKFFENLFSSDLRFGTDLYNLYCSGNVQSIERIDQNRFSVFAADNNSRYLFKFKSIIIHVPKLFSDNSPIIYIECDDDEVDGIDEITHDREIKLVETVYDTEKENEIFDQSKIYDYDFSNERYQQRFRFLTSGLFCFLNFQSLPYNKAIKSFIYNEWKTDGKEFEVLLRKTINKKKYVYFKQ